MRNFLLIITVIVIFLVSFICGYYIYKENSVEDKPIQLATPRVDSIDLNDVNVFSPSLLTSTIEEKISPNATLIIKKYYNNCGHTTKEYAEIPAEFINLKEEELKEKLTVWELKGFSPEEIVIQKEEAGICNEHYVIKEKDGNVAIYNIDENNKENLLELTEIATKYLTEQDQIDLKQGITATGKEELNSKLEDFE